jgi:transcriptional regulator with XRE-family HTH domain
MEPLPTFDQALAERLRELRKGWNLSLEDVAAAARSLGLDWSRGTVWAIERVERRPGGSGSRRLGMSEFLVLSAILERALARDRARRQVSLDDVMPRADQVVIGTLRLPGEVLRATLKGSPFNPDDFEDPELRSQHLARSKEREALEALARAVMPELADEVLTWARSSVERSVAHKLEVAPELAAMAGYRRWGKSLTAHRDELVPEDPRAAPNDEAARRRRNADRGHATREILGDVRFLEVLQELQDGLEGPIAPGDARFAGQERCRWCEGDGLILCPGSRGRTLSVGQRSVDDIRRVLVARYCEDEELRIRIDTEALAQHDQTHGEGEEPCVWCGGIGDAPAFVPCPRCWGSGVDRDPEACIPAPSAAPRRGLGSTEDSVPIPRPILRALVAAYLDDGELRAQIDERIGAS